MPIIGSIQKLSGRLANPVAYTLVLGDQTLLLNEYVGARVRLSYQGAIHCSNCGRKTAKSFSQGYCFPCSQRLARCDFCLVKPERCHYHLGTCREPSWGEQHCFIPHIIYVANTSSAKVGITRHTHVPNRWIDQGARCARPILQVMSRLHAGLIEVVLAKYLPDKTNWRAMLREDATPIDLASIGNHLLQQTQPQLENLRNERQVSWQVLANPETLSISYPIQAYPEKLVTYDLDKQAVLIDRLIGIKGQYLLFEHGVLNVRKYTGYTVQLEID